MLVLADGQPLDLGSWLLADYQVIEATLGELDGRRRLGFVD